MKAGNSAASRSAVNANRGGMRAAFGSKNAPPMFSASLRSKEQIAAITLAVETEVLNFTKEMDRGPRPSEYQVLLSNVLQRERYGICAEDGVRLGMRGRHGLVIPTGPLSGMKIMDAQVQLSGEALKPLDVLLKTDRGDEVMLSAGQSTKGGGGSGEKPPVRSAADKWLHGTTGGVVPMAFLSDVITKNSRVPSFLAMCKQGIMPDLNFEFPLQQNTEVDELFEGTYLRDAKSGVGTPREEGTSTGNWVQARFINANLACRGYTWYSRETQELLSSRGGQILGVQQRDQNLLMRAPGQITDRDIFLAVWYGYELGYVRRYDGDGNAWDVATQEVPWGKAEIIGTNAPNHMGWWDYANGKLYYAKSHATDYRKYGEATEAPASIFPGNSAGKQGFLQALMFLHKIMADKFETLNAVWVPQDFLYALAQDEFWQNALYNRNNQVVRLMGEAGYVSSISLPGTSEEIAIFKYQRGHLPSAAASLLRTTDAAPVDIDELIIGCSLGELVTNMPFWPFTMMRYPEYGPATVDGQSVIQPTFRDVLVGYHMEAVEPWNLRKGAILKCMNKARP